MEKKQTRSQYLPASWIPFEEDVQSQRLDNKNKSASRSDVDDTIKIKNESLNSIGQSGNSDVDVQVDVHVDTTPIAFALLCSMLANKQMNRMEFEQAVRRLERLSVRNENNISLRELSNLTNLSGSRRGRKKVE